MSLSETERIGLCYSNGPGTDNKLEIGGEFVLQDHLGSTMGLVSSAGILTTSTEYDLFGNASNTPFQIRYQFTGREFDDATGLQYSRARWYDPQIGKFISEDPIGFGGGDVNLYGYVKNRPTMLRDPSGKIPIVVPLIAGAIAAEGILHIYLGERARSIKWPEPDDFGRKKHCYVNCMSTRIHLLNPAPVTFAGLSQEAVNWGYQGAPLYESLGDLRANMEGQSDSIIIWRSCEDLCKTCQ